MTEGTPTLPQEPDSPAFIVIEASQGSSAKGSSTKKRRKFTEDTDFSPETHSIS